MTTIPFDLAASARAEMIHEGFDPDFPPGVADELAALLTRGDAGPLHDGIHDFRALLWSSIDNASSRDLDQVEVADRVAAAPGVRDYGLLSATAQMNARVEKLFTLPPTAFSPPPDVFSTVLRLEFAPRFVELGVDAAGFDKFLRASFAQKRKTLTNNLRAAGYSAAQLQAAWPAEIPLLARAESLALEPMAKLYRTLGPVKN